MFKRVLPTIVFAAILSACASTAEGPAVAKTPTVAAALAQADAAIKEGQNEKAYAILKSAGSAHPADKAPWVRMAQLCFDSAHYGDAIVNALAALERDPDDTLANSIVAVAGLRVTAKSLADLSQKNNLNGNVRTEAQDLAKLLRSSLGEEQLVPGARPAARKDPSVKRVIGAPPPPAKPVKSGSGDPFDALK